MAILSRRSVGFSPQHGSPRPLPGYGSAQQAPYTSLYLAPQSPISRAVNAPWHMQAHQPPQVFAAHMVMVNGLQTVAGQIAPPSLYDPASSLGDTTKKSGY